jgi:hypothetical protein
VKDVEQVADPPGVAGSADGGPDVGLGHRRVDGSRRAPPVREPTRSRTWHGPLSVPVTRPGSCTVNKWAAARRRAWRVLCLADKTGEEAGRCDGIAAARECRAGFGAPTSAVPAHPARASAPAAMNVAAPGHVPIRPMTMSSEIRCSRNLFSQPRSAAGPCIRRFQLGRRVPCETHLDAVGDAAGVRAHPRFVWVKDDPNLSRAVSRPPRSPRQSCGRGMTPESAPPPRSCSTPWTARKTQPPSF